MLIRIRECSVVLDRADYSVNGIQNVDTDLSHDSTLKREKDRVNGEDQRIRERHED